MGKHPMECNHEGYHISSGDGGFCPRCGVEDTVFGLYWWTGGAMPIVERFYRGSISHPEVDELLKGGNYKPLIMAKGGKWIKRDVL